MCINNLKTPITDNSEEERCWAMLAFMRDLNAQMEACLTH
jgi:hypothetical protein